MKQAREIWPSSCDLYQYSGAYPGVGAEERGQGFTFVTPEMSDLKFRLSRLSSETRWFCGALALAVADKV